ncbi:MAG: hypothetical protein EWM72_02955 [Nitrospira sp.]|nr:MAG: hypothetical protein EWM72_02955 [Nitrospira sp.]
MTFAQEIGAALTSASTSGNSQAGNVNQLIGPPQSLRIHGFGLPPRHGSEARILLVLSDPLTGKPTHEYASRHRPFHPFENAAIVPL